MKNKHCNDCGTLVQYDGHDCEDYTRDRDDIIICDECGLKSRCFCDECGEYVPTSECVVEDLLENGIEITEVLCSQCQDENVEEYDYDGVCNYCDDSNCDNGSCTI